MFSFIHFPEHSHFAQITCECKVLEQSEGTSGKVMFFFSRNKIFRTKIRSFKTLHLKISISFIFLKRSTRINLVNKEIQWRAPFARGKSIFSRSKLCIKYVWGYNTNRIIRNDQSITANLNWINSRIAMRYGSDKSELIRMRKRMETEWKYWKERVDRMNERECGQCLQL